jgi:DNA-binding XRE family transcriptional regulator
MKFNRNIPKILKDKRKELNLTQAQLAKKIGVKRWSIADYETGRLRTPLDVYLSVMELQDEAPA